MTLLSGYLPSERVAGLEEIVPEKFRQAVAFYDDFDYLGIRIRNEYWQNIKAVVHAGNTVRILKFTEVSLNGGLYRVGVDFCSVSSFALDYWLIPLRKNCCRESSTWSSSIVTTSSVALD